MKRFLLALTAAAALCALADDNVTSVTISQRWPWSCKVDVTYTLAADAATTSACPFFATTFTAYLGSTQYVMRSISGDGASGLAFWEGAHVLTWDAGKDLPAETQADNLKVVVNAQDVSNFSTYLCLDCNTGLITHYDSAPATYTYADKTDYMWFRRVDPGTFNIGCLESEPNDGVDRKWKEPYHPVTIARPYFISVFELTRGQEAALGYVQPVAPKDLGTDDMPTDTVSFQDLRGADAGMTWPENTDHRVDPGCFFDVMRRKAGNGLKFDLPTALQWEVAARAGVESPNWPNGLPVLPDLKIDNNHYLADTNLNAIAVYAQNGGKMQAVGSKEPNNWGLYDMIGNKAEIILGWPADSSLQNYVNETNIPDYPGPATGANVKRSVRGGYHGDNSYACRPANRTIILANSETRYDKTGVRIVIPL